MSAGAFRKVYDPGAPGGRQEYLNDHTFVRGSDGTWHLFGITGSEGGAAADEKTFAHATAPTLTGPWTRQRSALTLNPATSGSGTCGPRT